ncbi:MAG TPA: prephenate dehydratase [Thermoanaerobaculia bacterium]|nr:prephenate dehydratase [Thermoanaerobaculia bacterium]
MSQAHHPPDLAALRDEIEQLDRRLLDCLKERMRLAERVATAKIQAAAPFRDRVRHEQVIQRARHLATELELDPHQIEHLYRLILEISISHQQSHLKNLADTPLRVAYQGVEGSFSHLTAQRRYAGRKGGVVLNGYETFRRAADSVRDGSNDYALLPIENSTAGSINETYDLLAEGDLKINAEVVTAVSHCLLGLPGARRESLRLVLSHPQALAQCERFLSQELPHARAQTEFDTAGAARRVSEGNDPTVAAIASESAAEVFGLEVMAYGIQTAALNYTRFFEIALEADACQPDIRCKTSLLLATGHRPGDLGEVLRQFSDRGVNLTKLESRPIPAKPWEYRFYLDVEGHAASHQVAAALAAIEPFTSELRIIGTYPAAAPTGSGAPAPAPAEVVAEDAPGRGRTEP